MISKYRIILYISLLVGAYFAGMSQSKEVIKRELKIVQKEVIIDRDVIRYITHKDGTKEIIVDKSKEVSKAKEIKLIEQIPVDRKWLLGLSADVSKDFKLKPNYVLSVDHKVMKDLYIGVYYSTDHAFGVSLRVSF